MAFARQAAALLQKLREYTGGVDFTDWNSIIQIPILSQLLEKLESLSARTKQERS